MCLILRYSRVLDEAAGLVMARGWLLLLQAVVNHSEASPRVLSVVVCRGQGKTAVHICLVR